MWAYNPVDTELVTSNKLILVAPKVLSFWGLISHPCEPERLGQQRFIDTAVHAHKRLYEDKPKAIPSPGKIL